MQFKINLPYSIRRPCAENRNIPVLSIRFVELATFRTRPANCWIDLFNLSRRFFSARLRASRPLLLWMHQYKKKLVNKSSCSFWKFYFCAYHIQSITLRDSSVVWNWFFQQKKCFGSSFFLSTNLVWNANFKMCNCYQYIIQNWLNVSRSSDDSFIIWNGLSFKFSIGWN